MSKVTSAPIIGLPLANGWSQVTKNEISNLVCAFSVAGIGAGNIGRDVSNQIRCTKVSSASELHQFILDLVKKLRETNNELQMAAALLINGQMTLVTYNGYILLKRGEKVGKIINSDGEVKVIQGEKELEDVLILITNQAQRFAGEIKQKFLRGFDTDSVITSIVPGIQDQEDSSLSALTFVSQIYKEDAEPEKNLELNLEFLTDEDEDEKEIENFSESDLKTDPKTYLATTSYQPTAQEKKPKDIKIKVNPNFSKIFVSLVELLKKIAKTTKNTLIASKNKLFPMFNNVFLKLTDLIRQIKPSKNVYVSNYSKKKVAKIAFIGLSVILIIAAVFVVRQFSISKQKKIVAEQIATTKTLIESAQQAADTDPITARENITTAINELEAAKTDFENQKIALKIIEEKLTSAKQFYEEISGKDEFQELTVFFNLRDKESNFVTSKADLNKKTAVFLDIEAQKIIKLNLENKETELGVLEKYEQLTDVNFTNNVYLLGSGIHKFSSDNLSSAETLKEEGDSDRDGKFISSFGTYLYIFNPEKRNIYRYAQREDGLSDPIGWLVSKKDLEFDQINSMAIDGDLWLSTKKGEVKKFTKGYEEEFNISGLAEPIDSAITIFTKEDFAYLYVLEPDKRRIVVLTKNGEFYREIKSASLASTTTLIVSEEMNKAFAISGSIVFEVGL